MVDWQLTATTIYCPDIDEEVTVMVNGDWSTRCTGYLKYSRPDKQTQKLLKQKGRRVEKKLSCQSVGCDLVNRYVDKLKAEEKVA